MLSLRGLKARGPQVCYSKCQNYSIRNIIYMWGWALIPPDHEVQEMLNYPITLTLDSNGTFLVGFPDIPEANSVGDSAVEAMANGVDALVTALAIYFEEDRSIPVPSEPLPEQPVVALPALETAKVLLWNKTHKSCRPL